MLLNDHLSSIETDLASIILEISKVGPMIEAAFATNQGKAGTTNIYGEEQLALDKAADGLIVDHLSKTIPTLVASISSEERPEIVRVNPDGKFSVVLDPLDGSSLVDVNLAVGTIVGIYPGDTPLQPGSELVAAMYILYGPMTVLVYWAGKGVHEFYLDDEGQYQLLNEDLKIPDGKIFAPGALRKDWLQTHEKFIEDLEGEGYKLRYSGSFVADAHQILHKGGIFTYPGYKGRETGKLRLLFEGNPIGRIITEAGGAASIGTKGMLDVAPEKLDHRVPFYIGSKGVIEKAERYMKEN